MARFGFIHDKLDLKLLVLYIMARVASPIDFATLTDLAMCDNGVDYFQFAEVVSELLDSGHLSRKGEYYSATKKGMRTCADGESSLSPIIRTRCDQRLAPLNQTLKRKAQVRATLNPHQNGCDVCLAMDDEKGSLFSLSLLSPSQKEGQRIADHFLAHPSQVYNNILEILLSGEENRGDNP